MISVLTTSFYTNMYFMCMQTKAIVRMENIGSYMQDQLKHYMDTSKNFYTYTYSKQIAISSATYSGFEELTAAIIGMFCKY